MERSGGLTARVTPRPRLRRPGSWRKDPELCISLGRPSAIGLAENLGIVDLLLTAADVQEVADALSKIEVPGTAYLKPR